MISKTFLRIPNVVRRDCIRSWYKIWRRSQIDFGVDFRGHLVVAHTVSISSSPIVGLPPSMNFREERPMQHTCCVRHFLRHRTTLTSITLLSFGHSRNYYIKNIVLFEENSILPLPGRSEASGVESVWGEVSQESPKNR